jgi:hypothetical protein
MKLPVFLSFPQPFNSAQEAFVSSLVDRLSERNIAARTLGVNEYDNEVPLGIVRRMLLESNGVIAVALRRYEIASCVMKPGARDERQFEKTWFTSPWPHIETAMGYQLGLPILVLREQGTHTDGVLERGTLDRSRVLEVDIDDGQSFLNGREWLGCFESWAHDVRSVARSRGAPPKLY